MAAACDILSLHIALTPQTRNLVNAEVLAQLRPGAYFINTSRAEIVDHAALAAAIQEKSLRVGLDVFEKEPATSTGTMEDPILKLPSVYGTHHVGASTDQAQTAIADETVRIVAAYVQTGQAPNSVNLCNRSPAKRLLVVRHRNKPGVLAHVLHEISVAGINVEEMENVIFADALASCAKIRLDESPDQAVLERIQRGSEHVLAVSLLDLPG